jgi:hypothetical protein
VDGVERVVAIGDVRGADDQLVGMPTRRGLVDEFATRTSEALRDDFVDPAGGPEQKSLSRGYRSAPDARRSSPVEFLVRFSGKVLARAT